MEENKNNLSNMPVNGVETPAGGGQPPQNAAPSQPQTYAEQLREQYAQQNGGAQNNVTGVPYGQQVQGDGVPYGQPPQAGVQPPYGQPMPDGQVPYGQGAPGGQPYGGQGGMQPPYGYGNGQYAPQPPKKKKTGLIIGLVAGAVAIIALVIVLIFVFKGDKGGHSENHKDNTHNNAKIDEKKKDKDDEKKDTDEKEKDKENEKKDKDNKKKDRSRSKEEILGWMKEDIVNKSFYDKYAAIPMDLKIADAREQFKGDNTYMNGSFITINDKDVDLSSINLIFDDDGILLAKGLDFAVPEILDMTFDDDIESKVEGKTMEDLKNEFGTEPCLVNVSHMGDIKAEKYCYVDQNMKKLELDFKDGKVFFAYVSDLFDLYESIYKLR